MSSGVHQRKMNLRQSTRSSDPRSEGRKPTDTAVRLGQVFTPDGLSDEMCSTLLKNRSASSLKILDPCVGPGTFLTAMERTGLLKKADRVWAYDVDPMMVEKAKKRTKRGYPAHFFVEDFLLATPSESFDVAILNPPYVRQEWIVDKQRYRKSFQDEAQLQIPGTSNLYVYFIAKVVQLLKPGGRFACIVYDSWQSTLYGQWLMSYIGRTCKDVTVTSLPRQPFEGHLIDAVIIYATKQSSPDQETNVSLATQAPSPFGQMNGFLPIEKLFDTRRGLRLKQADFFLCELSEFEKRGAVPFVKKLSGHKGFRIPSDHGEGALLVTTDKPNSAVLRELNRRIQLAELDPEKNVSILTWFRERPAVWFRHSPPPTAPIIFNYYLRNRPRHISNTRVFSDNFYGLTPKSGTVPMAAWIAVLNSTATCLEILAKSRNQGSGLAKVQLFEYRSASVLNVCELGKGDIKTLSKLGARLLSNSEDSVTLINEIDDAIYSVVGSPSLKRARLSKAHKQMIGASQLSRHDRTMVVC
jgi:adenine-specific DNA-methyltransferase